MIASTRRRPLALALAFCCTALAAVSIATEAPARATTPPPTPATEIVVKMSSDSSIGDVTAAFPVRVIDPVLASRRIYLVECTDAQCARPGKVVDLAKKIAAAHLGVVYAQPDTPVSVVDSQFHSWPYGLPSAPSTLPPRWTHQAAVSGLDLPAARTLSRGAGTVVAVLDTGVDSGSPVLAGRVLPGWNYVDDDANTADVATGIDDNHDGVVDSAVGHGTFVSGMVSLVAPGAKILPERVLDSDGYGSVFVVAQAILDAVDAGADVINLSFGTATRLTSPLIADALHVADQHNVVVVAAAGNDASNQRHYPAATAPVLSVGATQGGTSSALASFSDWGGWVAVGAPGQSLIGPYPGGGFVTWSGTSMAAPLVAGQAALVRAVVPALPARAVVDAITHTARTNPDHMLHFGAIDVVASLEDAAAARR